WQLMWVLGLWIGHEYASGREESIRPPLWIGRIALAYFLWWMVWRHLSGQSPMPEGSQLNILFDKWTLGPMRVLDFLSLLVVSLVYGPQLARYVRIRPLVWLGGAALAAFCAHLLVVLATLAFFGEANATRSW